jgi:hypothetical protein
MRRRRRPRSFSVPSPADPPLPEIKTYLLDRTRSLEFQTAMKRHEDPQRWRDMTKPEREALVALVADALERLSRHPEEWLPDNLMVMPDGRLGMVLLWQLDHVKVEVVAQRQRAARLDEERIAALTKMAGLDGTQPAPG